MVVRMSGSRRPGDWLDAVEPDAADAREASHIRRIIAANDAVESAQGELVAAVAAAREAAEGPRPVGRRRRTQLAAVPAD